VKNHFQEICRECSTVIAQCRCSTPGKETRYGLCVSCAAPIKSTSLTQDNLAPAKEGKEVSRLAGEDLEAKILALFIPGDARSGHEIMSAILVREMADLHAMIVSLVERGKLVVTLDWRFKLAE
jgi:hypothetical protein